MKFSKNHQNINDIVKYQSFILIKIRENPNWFIRKAP